MAVKQLGTGAPPAPPSTALSVPPAPSAPAAPSLPAPSSGGVVYNMQVVQEQFLELLPQFTPTQFALVRRQYFSEVAQPETIVQVAFLCKTKQLDITSKPYHVVTIKNKDYIWASIGLYRIIAHRTGEFVGVDEPEYGPEIEIKYGIGKAERIYTVPQWCKVTVYRWRHGAPRPFTAKVYYREQVVLKDGLPNDMWDRRPYGQMAKGAESLALRIAFPEVGSEPTMEEMEGREPDYHPADVLVNEDGEPLARKPDPETGEPMTRQQQEQKLKTAFARAGRAKAEEQQAASDLPTQSDTLSPAETVEAEEVTDVTPEPARGSDTQEQQQESVPSNASASTPPPPPPPPPVTPPAPDKVPTQAELAAARAEQAPPNDDNRVVTKEELQELFNIAKASGWTNKDAATEIAEQIKVKVSDVPKLLTLNDWRELCDYFAEVQHPGSEEESK